MADLRPEPEVVALKAAEICERTCIEYAIIGGLAVGAFGVHRITEDADLVVALGKEELDRVDPFLAELVAAGFRLKPEGVRRRFERGRNLFATHLGLTRIDFMLKRPDAYWQESLRHRRRLPLLGREVWFASPEDVVALKLVAGRPEDLRDVRAVLNVKRFELDRPRLRATVERFAATVPKPDLPAHLERLLAETDALPTEPLEDLEE